MHAYNNYVGKLNRTKGTRAHSRDKRETVQRLPLLMRPSIVCPHCERSVLVSCWHGALLTKHYVGGRPGGGPICIYSGQTYNRPMPDWPDSQDFRKAARLWLGLTPKVQTNMEHLAAYALALEDLAL
jgi:hypothetical protein